MSEREVAGKVGAIAPDLEEPMVKAYYRAARYLAKRVKIHPNIVSLSRLALMVWLTWSFYKGKHVIAAALAVQACFFLDHLDGEMARTHNLVTPFGDYLDHALDLFYGWPLLYVIGTKLRKKKSFWPVMGIVGATTAASGLVIACQEVLLAERDPEKASASLSASRRMCPASVGKHLHGLRYFGMGTLNIVIGVAMVYTHYYA